MSYEQKYLKYKEKYLALKKKLASKVQSGGSLDIMNVDNLTETPSYNQKGGVAPFPAAFEGNPIKTDDTFNYSNESRNAHITYNGKIFKSNNPLTYGHFNTMDADAHHANRDMPKTEPTAEVQAEPTAEVQAEPTAEVQAEPTAEAQAEPTAEVQAEPTAEVQAEPTAEVQPEAKTDVITADPIKPEMKKPIKTDIMMETELGETPTQESLQKELGDVVAAPSA